MQESLEDENSAWNTFSFCSMRQLESLNRSPTDASCKASNAFLLISKKIAHAQHPTHMHLVTST